MTDFVFSIGTKAGGSESVAVDRVGGTSPGPYTLALHANVPATVRVGDKFVDSAGKTFLITGPESTNRRIVSGMTLTVHKAQVNAPFNSTTDPATGPGTIARAFDICNGTGKFETVTRTALTGNIQGEVWESFTQATNFLLFGSTGASPTSRRRVASAPGVGFRDNSNKTSNPLRVNPSAGVVVTVTGAGSEGWFKPVEDYCEFDGLQISLRNVTNTGVYYDGGNHTKVHDCIIQMTSADRGNTAFKALAGSDHEFARIAYYIENATGSDNAVGSVLAPQVNVHECTFLIATDHAGSPQATFGFSWNGAINSSYWNNALLGVFTANQAFTTAGSTFFTTGNNLYSASADDPDAPGSNNVRIDNATAGQLIGDILIGLTTGNEDLRPKGSTSIVGRGRSASTRDVLNLPYANPPTAGAAELAGGPALPFWATRLRLLDNTWEDIPESVPIGTQIVQTQPYPGVPVDPVTGIQTYYQGWTGGPSAIMQNWSGGAYLDAYSTYGAYVIRGNGHWINAYQYHNNMVAAWNSDTAHWEVAVPAWFDPNKVNPRPGIFVGGNASASLWWSTSSSADHKLYWHNPANLPQTEQLDSDLGLHVEYDAGIPAGSHTYGNCMPLEPAMGGSAKGSLLLWMTANAGAGANGQYYGSHEANLVTRTWSRHSSNTVITSTSSARPSGSWAKDTRRKKGWFLLYNADGGTAPYTGPVMLDLDPTSPSYKQQKQSRMSCTGLSGREASMVYFQHPSDPTQDLIVSHAVTLYFAWAEELYNNALVYPSFLPSIKWYVGSQTGRPPAGTTMLGSEGARYTGFALVPEQNAAYCIDKGGPGIPTPADITLWRLSPPAAWLNGTSTKVSMQNGSAGPFTWTSFALTRLDSSAGGPGPYPIHATQNPNDWSNPTLGPGKGNGTWNRFMYARKAKCFLLSDTEAMKMRAFRPAGLV